MASPDFAALTGAALDPLLLAAGFASGQYSAETNVDPASATGAGVLFCAAHDDFSDRHPWLPQSNAQPRGAGECLDLSLRFDEQHRFMDADLEDYTVSETLRLLGHHADANAIDQLTGVGLREALPVLAAVLATMLNAPA